MDSYSILKFWFGNDLSLLKSINYEHNPALWFKPKWETDELIKEKFSVLFEQAENGELDTEWLKDPKSSLALIILLHQFSRAFFRGTQKMFSNDSKAVSIAIALIDDEKSFQEFSLIEKFFIFMVLSHSEDLSLSLKALKGCEELVKNAPGLQKKNFVKYSQTIRGNNEILKKFGRYPQRNNLLGRKSTKIEIEFLEKNKHSYAKSVLPLKKSTDTVSFASKSLATKTALPFQRLLFLHGFRQNSNKIKKRMHKLLNLLKNESNAHVYFLNGTHPYVPKEEQAKQISESFGKNALNPIESQRVWYNSTDDSAVYQGIEESLDHLKQHIKAHGPYDGVIGFSQGSVLASLAIKQNPNLFRYFISISGFQANAIKYKDYYSIENPFDFPTMHIYGENDQFVTPLKSESFAKCFNKSFIAKHEAGHFAPDSWPSKKLSEFINNQSVNIIPITFLNELPIELNLIKLNDALVRSELDKINLESAFQTEMGKNLLNSKEFKDFFNDDSIKLQFCHQNDVAILNDNLLIIYLLLLRNKEKGFLDSSNDNTPENNKHLLRILEIWIKMYQSEPNLQKYLLDKAIEIFFVQPQHWRELIHLCDLAYNHKVNDLYEYLIEFFSSKIVIDLCLLDNKLRTHHVKNLISTHNIDELKLLKAGENISDLAKFMPRVKSHIDKNSRIAREVALRLNSYKKLDAEKEDECKKAKILSYNHYRKVLTNLSHYLNSLNETYFENTNPRYNLYLARGDKTVMEHLMQAPLSDAIINPVPEPVDISSHDQMKPLYEWLNKNNPFTEHDLKFLRGTVTKDGRLDLCKQVIGPSGIHPLLDSMKENKQIDRLLLGNNIVGDEGGKVIGEFIKSGKSPLKIWYIAGNNFTEKGIKPICEALMNDTQVKALWLKRNPLKSAGMLHIGELLRHNTKIEVLDLLNCGLLDAGVKILFDALVHNRTLKHLYLSANGITSVGLEYISDYLSSGKSILETLFLGCNRIGDEGANILSRGLKFDKKLERLNLASSRIGSKGMKYLADALENHPVLTVLDLGYMRSTMDMGELGNYIEDEGAFYLSKLIPTLKKLLSLSITHNHITQNGMKIIVDAIINKSYLINFDYVQYGVSLNDEILNNLRKQLQLNKETLQKTHSNEMIEFLMIPLHVNEIYSVYRTH